MKNLLFFGKWKKGKVHKTYSRGFSKEQESRLNESGPINYLSKFP